MKNFAPLAKDLVVTPRRSRAPRAAVAAALLMSGGLLFGASPAHAEGSKFAVIDVRRAVLETEQGLRVQAALKKLFDNRQVELDSKQRELQKEKEKLDKDAQSGKVSKETLQKKYENLQKEAADMQTTMVDYQREMQRKEGEMTTPILTGILDAVKRIAAQDGYEMVLEKSAVPYFRGDLELTDRAIQMYNSGSGGSPKPGAPGSKEPPAPKPAPAPTK